MKVKPLQLLRGGEADANPEGWIATLPLVARDDDIEYVPIGNARTP